eukprot:Pgem_evm1s10811
MNGSLGLSATESGCRLDHCITLDTTTPTNCRCLQCENNYELFLNECLSTCDFTSIPYCSYYSTTGCVCSICFDGYELTKDNKSCINKNKEDVANPQAGPEDDSRSESTWLGGSSVSIML